MKTTIIKNEPKEVILEFDDLDTTMPDFLASILSDNPDVSFAGVSQTHPEVDKPRLVVRTEKKKAADVIEKAIDNVDGELSTIKSSVSKKK